jgi:phospholipid/cholesterol/gamma-HCH transport system substrate-binding protein
MTRSAAPRLVRVFAVVAAACFAVAAVVVVVKYANGAFSGQYALSGMFPQSGEGLHPGSEVVYRGVQVGRVTSVTLDRRMANVDMAIDPSFKVPSDSTATIRPINVFGADQVELTFPQGDHNRSLAAGDVLHRTAVSPELGDLFAAAAPLLGQIDATDLSSVVSDLAQASEGEGPTIRRSVEEGAQLAALLDKTLPAQLSALDSFSGFVNTIEPTASSFNAISAASNIALPAFNGAAAQYARLLKSLAPFAENLAQFLAAYHPDFETLLDSGDNVARVIISQQSQVGQVIQGLGNYFAVFAKALDPAEVLPDGSHFGYFQTFVSFSDINKLVCSLIAPAVPGLSSLQPLQQALTGSGTPFDCSSQLAAFDAAQAGSLQPAAASPSSTAQQSAQRLSTGIYQALGAPQPPGPTSGVAGIIGAVLGTGTQQSASSSAAGTGSGGSSSNGLGSILGGL